MQPASQGIVLSARLGFMLLFGLGGLALSAGCRSGPYVLAPGTPDPAGSILVTATRPTSCPVSQQPAIVDLRGDGRVPAWACLPTCPLGREYVTDVGPQVDGSAVLTPECQPGCDPGEHRTSYVDFGNAAHCSPGGLTDPGQRTTFARERNEQEQEQQIAHIGEEQEALAQAARRREERQVGEAERRQENLAALTRLEDGVAELEAATVPWNREQIQLHYDAPYYLRDIAEEVAVEPARRVALSERIAALQPQEAASERDRGVKPDPCMSTFRHRSCGGRSRKWPPTTRAMRVRGCQEACDDDSSRSCRAQCARLPPGACDACQQGLDSCRMRCVNAP